MSWLLRRAELFAGIYVALNLDDGAEMESDPVKIISEHRLIETLKKPTCPFFNVTSFLFFFV